MADIMERRVTRSRSNELQKAQVMSNKSPIKLNMNSAREQPVDAYQIQGEQQIQPSTRAVGVELEQQPLVGTDGGADSAYGRNTSEEMYRCMNTVAPESEAAPLEQPQGSTPPETSREDSEELFRNWMATQIGLQNQNPRQSPTDTNLGQLQPGYPPQSTLLQGPRSQQEGSLRQSILDITQQGTLPQNAFPSDDAAPKDNSNSQKQRNNMPKEKGRNFPYTRFGPHKGLVNRDYPVTRSRSSGTDDRKHQSTELEEAFYPSADASFNGEEFDGSLESGLTTAIAPATPLTLASVGNEGNQSNNTDSNVMKGQAPMDSAVSHAAEANHNQHAQQQLGDLRSDSVSDELRLLRDSLKAKRPLRGVKQTQDGRRQLQQQTKKNEQQQIQGQQKQQQAKGKSSPAVNNRQDEPNRAQDLREQLQDGGLMQLGPSIPESLALAHSPTTSSAAALSQPTSDGPSTPGMAQARKHAASGEMLENDSGNADAPQKPELLARAGSITSSQKRGFPVNQLDGATKKRRVERHRKMTEAKGRSHASGMPEDLQAALKRCDNLEKDIRSLRLNLSFMNRKDSEQTKRIEELVQENDDLKLQKKGLMEQLEQVSARPQRDFVGGKRVSVGTWS